MSYFDVGAVQGFTLEPIPLFPREKQWLEVLEFLRESSYICFSPPAQYPFFITHKIEAIPEEIERLKAQLDQQEPLERRTDRTLEEVQG